MSSLNTYSNNAKYVFLSHIYPSVSSPTMSILIRVSDEMNLVLEVVAPVIAGVLMLVTVAGSIVLAVVCQHYHYGNIHVFMSALTNSNT